MKPWTLKTTFAARTGPRHCITGDVRINPGWGDETYNRSIEEIEFALPTGHRIRMAGYEQYNFFAECSEPLGGGSPRIEAFYLAGKTGQMVDIWRIGNGTVIRNQRPWGEEWSGGPTRGWKMGEKGRTKSGIVRQ